MSSFGEILSELRRDKSISQKELAKILHVSPATVSNYENGIHLPDIEKLMELADLFHVTTDYLLGRCDINLSPNVFQEPITSERSIGSFIRTVQKLPLDRREALCLILGDMELRATIDQYEERDTR